MKDLTNALARLNKASEARKAKEAEAAKVAKARAEARAKEERELGAILVSLARELGAEPAELVASFADFVKAGFVNVGTADFEESAATEELPTGVPNQTGDSLPSDVVPVYRATAGGD